MKHKEIYSRIRRNSQTEYVRWKMKWGLLTSAEKPTEQRSASRNIRVFDLFLAESKGL